MTCCCVHNVEVPLCWTEEKIKGKKESKQKKKKKAAKEKTGPGINIQEAQEKLRARIAELQGMYITMWLVILLLHLMRSTICDQIFRSSDGANWAEFRWVCFRIWTCGSVRGWDGVEKEMRGTMKTQEDGHIMGSFLSLLYSRTNLEFHQRKTYKHNCKSINNNNIIKFKTNINYIFPWTKTHTKYQ